MRTSYLASILSVAAACSSNHGTASPDAPAGDATSPDAPVTHSITVTLTNRPGAAATYGFVAAYQDGAAAWQPAPPGTGDSYTFPVVSSSWGFAWTCVTAGGATRAVHLYYFTIGETTSLAITVPDACTDRAASAMALHGTVSNPPLGGSLSVAFADTSAMASTGVSTTYALQPRPATRDLLVGHAATSAGDLVVDQAAVVRAVAATGATMTQDVNFQSAQGTQSATVAVPTSAGQSAAVTTTLYSAGGTIYTMVSQNAGPSFTSTGLAGALAQPGDVYAQRIGVSSATASATVERWIGAVANQTYAAPAPLGTVSASVPATTPYPRILTSWPYYASAIGYGWTASQTLTGGACGSGGTTCSVTWSALASPGSLGGSPALEMPDLSALPSWDARLNMHAGTAVTGEVSATTSTLGLADFPTSAPAAAGTSRTIAARTWTATP